MKRWRRSVADTEQQPVTGNGVALGVRLDLEGLATASHRRCAGGLEPLSVKCEGGADLVERVEHSVEWINSDAGLAEVPATADVGENSTRRTLRQRRVPVMAGLGLSFQFSRAY